MPARSLLPLLLAASLLSLPKRTRAEDWPQFRGPNSTGISPSTKKLPVEFSATQNVAWMHEVGEGIGSPVVAAGRVFTTAMVGEKGPGQKFVVFAYDAATGKELWQHPFPVGSEPLPPAHESNSYASATPVADAERVYVYFTRLGVAALDAQTGELVWKQVLPEPFFIFDWGPGMSPVLHGETLFFCQDDDLSPALYAFDRKTGKLLWQDDRGDMAVSYSHPVIAQTKQGPQLVVAGTGRLLGYDITNGKRLWATELFCRNIKTTPVVLDDLVYVSVESSGISYQWRAQADANGDG
ncbi:MAG: PQQ-binding-like beta-propeller repeat protein [Planctomycetaceae bacterium]